MVRNGFVFDYMASSGNNIVCHSLVVLILKNLQCKSVGKKVGTKLVLLKIPRVVVNSYTNWCDEISESSFF